MGAGMASRVAWRIEVVGLYELRGKIGLILE